MLSTTLSDRGDDAHLDLVFRALGDATRRGILKRLADGPAIVSELAQPFAMSLPAVGKHLRVLERAGLVRRRIDGRVHRCSLSASPLHGADEWLKHYRQFWEQTLDGLSRHFEKQ
jgi:DNA-binding transcriptional ArsR family regulator